ncbi:MAG: plasmid mobilization protein [Terracidiphilus sp.]
MQSPSQPAASASPTPDLSSFAGFLSALASPAPSSRNTAWNDDALADDVATLSYETALKAHSRYRPAAEPLPQPSSALVPERVSSAPGSFFSTAARQSHLSAPGPEDLKSASITVRMSQAECAQLKQRAAEAGMTISAYLRSCTFEAEALRGQVKDALAQLRAAASAETKQPAPAPDRPPRFGWLPRIFASEAPTRRERGHSCP